MATKRKRRKSGTTTKRRHTRHARRRSTTVVLANPRRRHHARRRYHRNPGGFNVRSIVGRTKDAAVGAVSVVAGEMGARLIRSRVLGMPAGTTMASVAEVGVGLGLGIVAERMVGRQVARDLTVGAFAGVLRQTAKQMGLPIVTEALADYPAALRVIRPGAARSLPRMSGYTGALTADQERQLGFAAP